MRRRQAGVRTVGHGRVAIAAIDAEIAGVVLMAERHRLRRRMDVRAGVIVRASKRDPRRRRPRQRGEAAPTKKRRSHVSALGEKIWVIRRPAL